MYRCKTKLELLIWHKSGASSYGLVESVPNCKSWKHIDEKWLQFGSEPRNIRLRMAIDGIHPFGNLSSLHFTWPMILLNYNFPLS
jgi:hypothetical protein